MSDSVAPLDAESVKKTTDALIDLAHYIPTLQSEANTFAETGAIDDGQRSVSRNFNGNCWSAARALVRSSITHKFFISHPNTLSVKPPPSAAQQCGTCQTKRYPANTIDGRTGTGFTTPR